MYSGNFDFGAPLCYKRAMRGFISGAWAALFLLSGLCMANGRFPWPRRIGREVESVHITGYKNTPVDLWPAEPEGPSTVDPAMFDEALGRLCGGNSGKIPELSAKIRTAAARFGIDPFLLAGLVYDGSGCRPGTFKWDAARGRFGLTGFPLEMHRRQIQKGIYRYYLGSSGAFQMRELDVSAYPYRESSLRRPVANLYFAAAVLAVFREQAEDLDRLFPGEPHRHFVSHFFYGDRVRGSEPENRVLAARRRILEYYLKFPVNTPTARYGELPLSAPVDGAPRLLLDYFGNRRGNPKGLGHRGIDIEASEGEPVRAVADGTVVFAGVDEPGGARHRLTTPDEAAELSPSEMGPGGLFVSINHGNDFGTIYMHLSALEVSYNARVKRGDILGLAGRSGADKAGPHLHLEFRVQTDRTDPAPYLSKVLVDPYRNGTK